ncbi:MAG TPA: Na-translocating system protein MpsC family protein [Solirubrobacteraceae bacterium]|nr:Na-translocating system protein MpsC family protein [Solirubrobacteraceae bacterium]
MSDRPTSTSASPDGQPLVCSDDGLMQVCGAVAAVFRRAWGRGPAKTTAHWAGPNMLVVLLANGHTDAEKSMRAAGHIQELLGGRRLLQHIIEDELKSSVERVLGREVETTLSATRLDPDLSAEIFLLAPAGD